MYKFSFLLLITTFILFLTSKAQNQKDFSQKKDSVQWSQDLNEIVIVGYNNQYKTSVPSKLLRLETPLIKIPQNIQIVNSQLLADQQIYSMSDAIARNVSGAAKLEGWGDLYTYITMRGSRASAFRNGMNTSGLYGILAEDASFIDKVEFVKGPAGFMMSNGEPSGIYNIVTKRPTGKDKSRVSIGTGSYGLYRTTLDMDGSLNKKHSLQYRLNIGGQTNNAFREYELTNRISIAPVLTYHFNKSTSLTFEYIYQYAKMPDLGVKYLFSKTGYATVPRNKTLSDPGFEATVVHDKNLTINLIHSFNKNWKLTAQASYFDYNQKGSFLWIKNIDTKGNLQRMQYIWDAKNEMSFTQLSVNGEHKTGIIEHKLLAGVDISSKSYVADLSQSYMLDSIGTFNIYNDYYQKPYYGIAEFDRSIDLKRRVGTSFLLESDVVGLYVQDDLSLFEDKLILTIAGRYTYVKENNYGAISKNRKFTPRLGITYSIVNKMNLYALYDQTFLPQSGKLRSGGTVKPLTGNNIELGIKKDWLSGRWNTLLSIYRIMKENQTSTDPDNVGGENYVLQFGQTKTQGIEFDLNGKLFTGMNIIANYAYTDSKITKSTTQYEKGTTVPGYAKHSINSWLNYHFQKGGLKNVSLSGGGTYMADRATWWSGDLEGEPLNNYFRFDGAVSWKYKEISLALNVYNILDKYLYNGSHHSSGWYYWRPENPRNFRLNMTYSF